MKNIALKVAIAINILSGAGLLAAFGFIIYHALIK